MSIQKIKWNEELIQYKVTGMSNIKIKININYQIISCRWFYDNLILFKIRD